MGETKIWMYNRETMTWEIARLFNPWDNVIVRTVWLQMLREDNPLESYVLSDSKPSEPPKEPEVLDLSAKGFNSAERFKLN